MKIKNVVHKIIFSLLFSVLIASCVNPGQSVKNVVLEPCTFGGIEGQCGTLQVYENREAQTERIININIIVVPAKTSPAEPDPLFFLAGGPGGGASQFIGTVESQFLEINQNRDLVYVDQRGTGGSNLLICPEGKEGEMPDEVFRTCLDEIDGDPQYYTTSIAMDDLDDVRAALGYEKINLYGISYGVTAAQVYMNRHPEHVRSVILDHGTLLQISFFDHWARNSQLALERLFALCEADQACHTAYPKLSSEFAALRESLAQPVDSGLFDPTTAQPIVFTGETFGRTIHFLLMQDNTAASLPFLIHKAAEGDWSPLAKEYMNSQNAGSQQLRRMVMTLEILCNEPWWGGNMENIQALGLDSYYLDAVLSDYTFLKSMCPYLPDPGSSAQHGPALPSDLPVLLFVGEIDPQNNLESLVGQQQLWPNSKIVVQPGVSHNFTPDPCWNSIMANFVNRATVNELPLDCVQGSQRLVFK